MLEQIFTGEEEGEESAAADGVHEKAHGYAAMLEASMWTAYNEPNTNTKAKGPAAAGKQYKDRLRTVLFSLKDKSNRSLHMRIANGEVPAHALATLSSDELANDTIRLAVEKAKRESLEQSILKKEEGPIRKITHKGEEEIEYEAGTILGNDQERDRRHLRSTEQDQANAESPTTPFTATFDKTHQEESTGSADAGQARHDSVSAKGASPSDSPNAAKRRATLSNVISPNLAQSAFSMGDIFGSPVEGQGDDQDRDSADVDASLYDPPSADTRSPVHEWSQENAANADDILDALDNPATQEHEEDATTSTTPQRSPPRATKQTISATPPPVVDRKLPSEVVWDGAFTMPEEATFSGSARQIAGRPLGTDSNLWARFFADAHATLEGRLPTKVACDYLLQCRQAPRIELIVLAFESSLQLSALASAGDDAPLTESSNQASFTKLLTYLQERQRYGVVPPSPLAKGQIIKDFYLGPLPKGAPLPEWLSSLEPPPAFEQMREQDLFLLVAVLNKGALDADLEAEKQKKKREAQQQAHASSQPTYSAPPATAAAAGGMALQDLLKAVGQGILPLSGPPTGPRSASTSNIHSRYGPPPPSAPPRPPASVAAAAAAAAAAPPMDALRQMPHGQLENLLHSNPAMVDQLLSSLQASGALAPPQAPTQMMRHGGTPPMQGYGATPLIHGSPFHSAATPPHFSGRAPSGQGFQLQPQHGFSPFSPHGQHQPGPPPAAPQHPFGHQQQHQMGYIPSPPQGPHPMHQQGYFPQQQQHQTHAPLPQLQQPAGRGAARGGRANRGGFRPPPTQDSGWGRRSG